ncbi:MAG: aminoacyl-tRNA deacylase [Propionicimonas sp.]|uniref:aminoacyl-tRNA deacylase n=1 Tax=Propionicimonas sp. TaxID=1955623 RepID=UPI002B21CE7F|nr:aminoacyl-tRNA deacylase [Propionicimonas sp.]MEA4944744.1 aminoacyl-tRNA deacylase [Propionicimonas sp.]MEA5054321.1 aminoacyl-tRNA deacylase [Propionicimonas sp.]MEA5116888.1 aminoacyl-tRNA deacylase [Propionicimonas sp.]
MPDQAPSRAVAALQALRVPHVATQYERANSLTEAAAQRGLTPADIVKSMVVRRGEDDYLFVLVGGDREISWPKLRTLLGVSRLSMPSAAVALAVTGYERGTITPFGSRHPWPVIVDADIPGRRISMGGGRHGLAIALDADDLVSALDATVADIADPPGL